jgi:predicted DsbA family dithiol-disulfide isomerase
MKNLKIDFVSDVACPWCAVGLGGLLTAIDRLKDEAQVEIHMQPFQLDPATPPGGQNMLERLMQKYGREKAQIQANWKMLAERAAAVNMPVVFTDDSRAYNTFAAHRLLYWAGLQGQEQQVALKRSLLKTYFKDNLDTSDPEVLARAARDAGLDEAAAREVVTSNQYVHEVSAQEEKWRGLGISSVPSVIINGKYLVSGGQPPEAFEQALRQIMAEDEAAA